MGIEFVRWQGDREQGSWTGNKREKLEYTVPEAFAASDVSSVRLLFHRSSKERGLVFLVNPDFDGRPVADRVARIGSVADAATFARRLEAGWFPKRKAG